MNDKQILQQKIFDNTVKVTESGCWIWMLSVSHDGYGKMKFKYKTLSAHRASYMAYVGDIPKGMLVCHVCDVKTCVNPSHLFIGTYKDNTQDMIRKGRAPVRSGTSVCGEESPRAKLTESQAKEIFYSQKKYREIALEYGISHGLIGAIKKKKKWKHIHG